MSPYGPDDRPDLVTIAKLKLIEAKRQQSMAGNYDITQLDYMADTGTLMDLLGPTAQRETGTDLFPDRTRITQSRAPGPSAPKSLRERITESINATSRENASNTPDHILAAYLMRCLDAYEIAVNARDHHYDLRLGINEGEGE